MQAPSIGRIVIYRNRLEQDCPAIITEVLGDLEHVPPGFIQGGRRVHLHLFPSPNTSTESLSPDYGVPHAEAPTPGCWRWPERVT